MSDNDGSAFITKAEFDSLKNNFQSQIDKYNTSIDSKIDGAIASYLAGISIAQEKSLTHATSRLTYPLKVYFNQEVSQLRNITTDYKTSATNYYRPNWDVELVGCLNIYFGVHKVNRDNYNDWNKFKDFFDGRLLTTVSGNKFYLATGWKKGVKLINTITTCVIHIGRGGWGGENTASSYPQNKAVGHLFMDTVKRNDFNSSYYDVDFVESSSWVKDFPLSTLPWTDNYAPFQWWSGASGTTFSSVTLSTGTYPNQRLYKHANAGFVGGRNNPGILSWASSLYTDGESQLDKIYMQAPSTNRMPVLYDTKIKMTNNKYKVQDLLSTFTAPTIWLDGSTSYDSSYWSGKLWFQHVIEPGLFIEPEGFSGNSSRQWYDMSLIDPAHIVYEVTSPETNTTYYQGMLDGFFGTELQGAMDVGCIKINCTHTGTTNKKYIILSKSPITFEGDPVGVDLSSSGLFNLANTRTATTWAKYIELNNGDNSIFFKYDGSQKNDKIYYKIITALGSTEYTTINSQPQFSYWPES